MSAPQGRPSDERWTATDAYTISHLHPSSKPNHAAITAAKEHSEANGLPDIGTNDNAAKMLALQCKFGKVSHALEVGTLGGVTPIWLTTMNPDLRVTTIEYEPKHAKVARENVERAGVADRVDVITGAGLDVLPKLQEQIEKGEKEPLGLTYIDADKGNNWAYFDWAVKLSRPGAVIYVDNVVQGGIIAKEPEDDSWRSRAVMGARKVIENVGKDTRVEALVQQTVGDHSYDGWLMAVVL